MYSITANLYSYTTENKTLEALANDINELFSEYQKWEEKIKDLQDIDNIQKINGFLHEIQYCWNLAKKREAELRSESYEFLTIPAFRLKMKKLSKIIHSEGDS